MFLGGVIIGEETAIWIAYKKPGNEHLMRKRIIILKNPRVSFDKKWSKLKTIVESCLKYNQDERCTLAELIKEMKERLIEIKGNDYWK